MQPLGDAFIKAIRMLIAPIVFCTVVHGVARMRDMARVGQGGDQGNYLFRSIDHRGAGDRSGGGEYPAAGEGDECRPFSRRYVEREAVPRADARTRRLRSF
jgi:hypothetical protein